MLQQSTMSIVLRAMGLAIGPVVAIGFSRFAYALLLPPMKADLAWSFTQAGAINTANAAGYIIGALAAGLFARLLGAARAFLAGIAISAITLLAMATGADFALLTLVRLVSGAANAVTFVIGAALAGSLAHRDSGAAGIPIGVYIGGAGAGIALSGFIVPMALELGDAGWRLGWLALGIAGLAAGAPAMLAARAVEASVHGAAARLRWAEIRQIWPTIAAYGLFGAGYVSYMTFVISLLRAQGNSASEANLFWIVLGIAAAFSPVIWSRWLARMPAGPGGAAVYLATAAGALLPLVFAGRMAVFASAILFGGSFLSASAAITIASKDQLPMKSLTAALALLTVAFAIGQTLGPVTSGAITDMVGGISSGLWISPALLLLAAMIALLQPAAVAGIHGRDLGSMPARKG